MKMNIDTGDRKLTKTEKNEVDSKLTIVTNTYDDGTVITFKMYEKHTKLESNKHMEMQDDGVTLKVID